jgi:hypothetical protein
MACHLAQVHQIARSHLADLETRFAQTVHYVAAVHAQMIELPEAALALLRIGDTGILIRVSHLPGHGHLDVRHPPGPQNPQQLAHGLAIIGNMLKNVATDNRSEASVFESRRRDVDMEIDARCALICSDVASETGVALETGPQAPLGREVQKLDGFAPRLPFL